MNTVTLRTKPTHWLGMALGAFLGVVLSGVIAFQVGGDAKRWAIYLMPGIPIGMLIGIGISAVVYRLRDHTAFEEDLFEKEIQLHKKFSQGTPLHAYFTALPGGYSSGDRWLTLLTSQFLIQATMHSRHCLLARDYVANESHHDCDELMSSIVLPNTNSIMAVPLSAIRRVSAHHGVVRVTAFDEDSGCDVMFSWQLPEETDTRSKFIWKLKEILGCRRPITRRHVSLKKKRFCLIVATIGAVVCWPLALKLSIARPHTAWFLAPAPLMLALAIAFTVTLIWNWRVPGELVIYEQELQTALGDSHKGAKPLRERQKNFAP